MTIEKADANAVIERCFRRFCEIHPDHTFAEKGVSFEIVEPDCFLPRLCEIARQYPIEGVDPDGDLARHFANCDAATMRAPDKDYVVISFKSKEAAIPFVIRIYHELAHIYCLDIQERKHPLDLQKTGDIIPGFLLWKEFIADYVALDALHHDLAKFSYTDQVTKDHIIASLKGIETNSSPDGLSAFSHMANFFAFMLNLKDVDKHIGKPMLPINRTAAGRKLHRYIKAVAQALYGQCRKESYAVVDLEFLDKLGYDMIEIQLYLEDYEDAFGW